MMGKPADILASNRRDALLHGTGTRRLWKRELRPIINVTHTAWRMLANPAFSMTCVGSRSGAGQPVSAQERTGGRPDHCARSAVGVQFLAPAGDQACPTVQLLVGALIAPTPAGEMADPSSGAAVRGPTAIG